MDKTFDIAELLAVRKVTRAISDLLHKQLTEHVATLSPLMQPRHVFGKHLGGGAKVRGEDDAFAQLQGINLELAKTSDYNLSEQLESPLEVVNTTPEISTAEFPYVAESGQESKAITITHPLKWVLSFSGFGPARLRSLIARRAAAVGNELQQCVLHFLVMHVALSRRPAVKRIFEALRFPISTELSEEFGGLPITYIECSVPTMRPADEIIIQSTEISGTPAFEDVVSVDGIQQMQDPLQETLLELIREHGNQLLTGDAEG